MSCFGHAFNQVKIQVHKGKCACKRPPFLNLLLLLQLYNSLWVLACSIISFHCFQFFTPIFLRSFFTSSSHLNLGLPFGLVAYVFHLYMVLTTLSFGILSTCPNQLNLLLLMYLNIFSYLITFSSSLFVLTYELLCIKVHKAKNLFSSSFQTFAVFWKLYAFFWVILRRLNFI